MKTAGTLGSEGAGLGEKNGSRSFSQSNEFYFSQTRPVAEVEGEWRYKEKVIRVSGECVGVSEAWLMVASKKLFLSHSRYRMLRSFHTDDN